MLGSHPFHTGQRVRPSAKGAAAGLFKPMRGITYEGGTVLSVDRFNKPTILWDGRRTVSSYHPDFIEPICPTPADGEK